MDSGADLVVLFVASWLIGQMVAAVGWFGWGFVTELRRQFRARDRAR